MRKSILAVLVCTIALFAMACGGKNGTSNTGNSGTTGGGCAAPAKADPEAQWKALYKKDAEWVMKMTGMYMKTKVVSVEGTKAKTKTWNFMGDKDPKFEGDGTDAEATYTAPAAAGTPDPKWKELGKGEDKVAGLDCSWVEGEYDGAKSKTWTSKVYGLVAKSESAGKTEIGRAHV